MKNFGVTDIATLAFIAIITLLIFARDNIIMGLVGLFFWSIDFHY